MTPLILIMLAHAGLCFALYALLTVARFRAVARGANSYTAFEFTDGEDRFAQRVSANLSNQFELPVLFHAGVLLLLYFDAADSAGAVIAGWAFIAGRLLHTGVQILTGNVRLRGLVFTINFLAVVALWGVIALEVFGG